ncbi:hypothetical protein BDV95DRAFT_575469 [Massariosphaeria phaeospora]|uniref:Uncharacterized protein n=1 Tax=Massariosphaeria phaeospora TaxID=100035 RepID=A0A7C8M8H3_9PLEO|nr:hypothetical protein BDV95DRAFT_575469 [Massariosphaeria phaeospora]
MTCISKSHPPSQPSSLRASPRYDFGMRFNVMLGTALHYCPEGWFKVLVTIHASIPKWSVVVLLLCTCFPCCVPSLCPIALPFCFLLRSAVSPWAYALPLPTAEALAAPMCICVSTSVRFSSVQLSSSCLKYDGGNGGALCCWSSTASLDPSAF